MFFRCVPPHVMVDFGIMKKITRQILRSAAISRIRPEGIAHLSHRLMQQKYCGQTLPKREKHIAHKLTY